MFYEKKVETQITGIGQWIANLAIEDIPEEVVDLAKLQFLDILAAIFAGSKSMFGEPIRQAVLRTTSSGPCTVLPGGERLAVLDAIYLHATLANAIELDNLVFMGHVGQSGVTVPLALAEMFKKNVKTMLLAQIAAVEVAGRMGAYFSTGPLQGHMRSYLHRTAGAVAASKMMGLDSKTTANALAIALSMPEFPLYPSAFSPDTKILCTSSPASEGARAAFMAAEGICPAMDILEHPAGFSAFFGQLKHPPDVCGQLGKTWALHALSCKMFAACAYAQGPVAAALDILKTHAIQPEMISRIDVAAPITTVTMESFSKPHRGAGITVVNTNFSTRRSVAAALVHGSLDGSFFSAEVFESKKEALEKLAAKTFIRHEWALSIDLIRGMDAALAHPGKPGVFGMSQTSKAFDRFREAIGSRKLIGAGDVPIILALPADDRDYLLTRLWRGYRSKLPFLSRLQKAQYRSFENDISKFSFRQSGRLEIHMTGGEKLTGFCRTPPGFAGHDNRAQDVMDKFIREAGSVCGKEAAIQVADYVFTLPDMPVNAIMEKLTNRS